MRPDRESDQDDDEEKAEEVRNKPEYRLPIYDPEDADVDPEDADVDPDADDFDDLEDDEDDDEEGGVLDDDLLAQEIEAEPRTVLITGACGNIGRKLRAAWTDVYDLILIDKDGGDDDPEIIEADLAILDDDWITHFHGVDTVVHLAANPDDRAPWDELVGPNLDALANVFHAAALAGVERLIFASSNHVMGGYKDLDDAPITVDLDPLPDGPYGVTKLVGERLGRSLARAFDMTFIGLRLGWVQPGKNRAETLPDDWSRKLWLSNADLVQLFDCAVEAEIEDRSFVVLNGMSRNHGMRWDLSETAELLGYLPVDDAFVALHAGEMAEQDE
ncbi:MAG: NAD-dependent epimerase/dehydratase family protein [Isosphaeraceae bacterium]